jgi:hypothetical protein
VQALCASAENAYGEPCFESRIEANLWHAEEQIVSNLAKQESRHALAELGFEIQREHFGEFRRHGRTSVWRSRGDHRQKTLYRF